MMKDAISILQQVVPDIIQEVNYRFRILTVVKEQGPIGRRNLAVELHQSERTLRTATDFLRHQGLITSSPNGMELTLKGVKALEDLRKVMEKLVRMNAKESALAQKLNLQRCRIVPGDSAGDASVLKEMGRQAALLLDELLPEGEFVVAVAGGTSVAAIVPYLSPELSEERHFIFVPARGGFGESMSVQANTISDQMAQMVGGENMALFVPDNLSQQALDLLRNEPTIASTIEAMKHANCLLYSIGNAKVMLERRKMPEGVKEQVMTSGAVGETFGCYFDETGKVVYRLSRFGLQIEDVERIPYAIAIAGGSSKAKALEVYARIAPAHTWLVTDEGAANLILKGETL